jgi:hypothetical protein
MMNTLICAAGCDGETGTAEELEMARKLCLEAPGMTLAGEQEMAVAPNAVEEYHDLKLVSSNCCVLFVGRQTVFVQ